MRRPLILTAIAGAILLATAGPASAAPGDYYADGSQSVTPGTGSASFVLEGDQFGNLEASASATGGTKFLVPILNLSPYSNQTSASARSYITDGVQVEEGGRYEMTVTFHNAVTAESETGNGQAQGEVFASAYLPEGYTSTPLGSASAELSSQPGTIVLRFEIEVPAGGGFAVSAEVQALSTATGTGNAASTESSAETIEFSFAKIG